MKELVKNVPDYALNLPVWVVSDLGPDGIWFYGAWELKDKGKANEIAMKLGKVVIIE